MCNEVSKKVNKAYIISLLIGQIQLNSTGGKCFENSFCNCLKNSLKSENFNDHLNF